MIAIRTTRAPDVVTVNISGSAELDTLEQLKAALDGAHAQALEASAPVVIDLLELEFATSSCLKVFANWLLDVSEAPNRYAVTFRSSTRHSWQRRSLTALTACAPDVVTVETQA